MCNKRRRSCRLQNILPIQIIRIRVTGFLSGNDTHAGSKTDALGCALDDLFLKNDGMVDAVFKIEICVIAAAGQRFG